MKKNKASVENLIIPKNISKIKSGMDKNFLDVLKMFAPGTSIRLALDDLLRAKMGALIVVDIEGLQDIIEKGFKVNTRFSSQKLVELAKMDGAIILSKDVKKILYANTFLFPNPEISTKETGTRHKAAERTAKQIKTIVIAISERKNKISLYYKDKNYKLEKSSELLRRAAETLQILEKQREVFDGLLNNLNFLELSRKVTTNDVCIVLQKFEIIKRISNIVKRYLVELGKEGIVVKMRLKELTGNLDKQEEMILKDYFHSSYSLAIKILEKMNFDFLLDPVNISRMLFEETHNESVSPKGLRILNKTNLLERNVDSLIGNFKTLDKILLASDKELFAVLKNDALVSFFREEIFNLKEKAKS